MKASRLILVFHLALALGTTAPGNTQESSILDKSADSQQEPTAATLITDIEPSLYDPRFVRSVIEYGYSRLSDFTRQNGTEIEFELGDFVTYRDVDFESVYIKDVFTLPGGETIQVVHRREIDQFGNVVKSSYEPSWVYRPRQIEKPKVAEKLQARLSEVISMNSDIYGGAVLGVTSFEVTAKLAERGRTYRAALIWIATEPGQKSIEDRDFRVELVDHITAGVNQALFTPPPVRPSQASSKPFSIPSQSSDPIARNVL